MTKSWQDYVQMQPQVGSSSDVPGEGVGLSDETEAERWARAMSMEGLGETIFEQDLTDLGLRPE